MLGASCVSLAATPASAAPAPRPMAQSPLLAPWSGPNGGVPAFDKVKVSDFEPAFQQGIALELETVDGIASNPAAPTFENTILALENSDEALRRAYTYYGVWAGNLNSPAFQAVDTRLSPQLSGAQDKINQNATLFKRIDTLYYSPAKAKLTPEQQRLI